MADACSAKLNVTNERSKLIMPATLEKPKVQCRYRNDEGWQCPLNAARSGIADERGLPAQWSWWAPRRYGDVPARIDPDGTHVLVPPWVRGFAGEHQIRQVALRSVDRRERAAEGSSVARRAATDAANHVRTRASGYNMGHHRPRRTLITCHRQDHGTPSKVERSAWITRSEQLSERSPTAGYRRPYSDCSPYALQA